MDVLHRLYCTSICFSSLRAVFRNANHTIISWASPVCITSLKNIFSERLSNQVIGGIVAGCIVFIKYIFRTPVQSSDWWYSGRLYCVYSSSNNCSTEHIQVILKRHILTK